MVGCLLCRVCTPTHNTSVIPDGMIQAQGNRMDVVNILSSPFKGEGRMRRLRLEAGRGMGSEAAEFTPIPSPTLPLKGRVFSPLHQGEGEG